jgi:hypothetical protein
VTEGLTVTVAVAVAGVVPVAPVAVAVYVVVAVGLTTCVPPVAERVYELPSVPVTVTPVAFVAVMVKVDEVVELPVKSVGGFAPIVTVGAGDALTVTVEVAVVDPPVPVAVAVYVVVALGLTFCVPPVAGKVYELPSVPVTVIPVAFVAVTVSIDELPAEIEVGFALMPTVGTIFAPPV